MTHEVAPSRTALVVEDEPMIARVCKRTLELEGYEVELANNGLIATEMSDMKPYDLYVSDIRTPEMNGIAFYRHIAATRPDVTGRVIFTTGDILSGDVRAFLEDVKPGFLPKPFTPSELRKVVHSTMTGAGVQ